MLDVQADLARAGRTTDGTNASPLEEYSLSRTRAATYVYVAPEVRFGRRLGDHFELSVGTQLLVMSALSSPSWDATEAVPSGTYGIGAFPKESFAGGVLVAVTPGIATKYEF